MRTLFLLHLAVFQLLLANPCFAAVDSPEACIFEIGNAVTHADEKKFEDLVNVDGIIGDMLDVFLQEASKPDASVKLPPLLAIIFSRAAIGGNDNSKLKVFLSYETKAFVLNGIASGVFAGRKAVSGGKGIVAPLFADVSTGKKEIRNIGKAKSVANGWLVPFRIHDFGNGRNYQVRGLVNKNNQGFRLVSIENMKSLLVQINNEYLQSTSGGTN